MTLKTTVVGSYPVTPERRALSRSYHTGEDPYLECIERAVEAQVEAGVQLITDGQTSNDMISLFAQGIKGFRKREKIQIVSQVAYKGPITVKDQEFVKGLIPKGVEIKGVITGPWTLANSVDDRHYDSPEDCMWDLVEVLHREAEALSSICSVIQIDEPYLSVEYEEQVKGAVESVLDVNVETALHVCGDVSDIASELVEYEVDILDHEFTDHPELYDVYADLDPSKRLAVGVVSTEPPAEKVDIIVDRINRVVDLFGPDSLVDPDCGLRFLPENVARDKLTNMVKARDVVWDERS